MQQVNDPQLLTRKQIQSRTGLSESTIERAIRSGALRAFRLGRSVRIDERDYLAWLESHRVNTGQSDRSAQSK